MLSVNCQVLPLRSSDRHSWKGLRKSHSVLELIHHKGAQLKIRSTSKLKLKEGKHDRNSDVSRVPSHWRQPKASGNAASCLQHGDRHNLNPYQRCGDHEAQQIAARQELFTPARLVILCLVVHEAQKGQECYEDSATNSCL